MTKMAKWVLAAALVGVAAGGAQAQRQPGGGGQGGRGGFMQTPLEVTLLTNADLQKELKLTDDQKKGLKDVTTKAEALNKERQEAFTGGGGGGREAFQALMEKGQKLTEEAKPVVEKALTADQKKRLKQIDVQRMGLAAFANEDVSKALKIGDDQKAELKSIGDDVQKDMQALRQEYFGGGFDPEKMAEYQKKAKAATDEAMGKATKKLTDDQKKAWKELTGEPFDVSKLQPQMRRRNN